MRRILREELTLISARIDHVEASIELLLAETRIIHQIVSALIRSKLQEQ